MKMMFEYKNKQKVQLCSLWHAYMALLIISTWQELFTVLAPWSVEHDESKFLFLEAGGEVVSIQLNYG